MPDSKDVSIGEIGLEGILTAPREGKGVVIFAHGSGSSRLSPRNRHVAEVIQSAGLGTLLFDLLTEDEADDRKRVFDIPLLAERLQMATAWLLERVDYEDTKIGYFGASTGAAAALVAASAAGKNISAVVSRGGRPDLAGDALPHVKAPTLLIVGGDDTQVLPLNEQALHALKCQKALEVVPGAAHLFEEPGKLEAVAQLAREWFERYMVKAPAPGSPA